CGVSQGFAEKLLKIDPVPVKALITTGSIGARRHPDRNAGSVVARRREIPRCCRNGTGFRRTGSCISLRLRKGQNAAPSGPVTLQRENSMLRKLGMALAATMLMAGTAFA